MAHAGQAARPLRLLTQGRCESVRQLAPMPAHGRKRSLADPIMYKFENGVGGGLVLSQERLGSVGDERNGSGRYAYC
jgi:hypothetical protein